MTLKKRVQKLVDKYYGRKMNVVQIFRDPNVDDDSYVVRFEDKSENFCCILNFSYVDYPHEDAQPLEDAMIEDYIELKPGQKITKKLFGSPRFF